MNPLFKKFYEALKGIKAQEQAAKAASPRGSRAAGRGGFQKRPIPRKISGQPATPPPNSIAQLKQRLWEEMIRPLGTLGQVVEALIRPSGRATTREMEREIDAAQKLIEALSQPVDKPGGKPLSTASGANRTAPPLPAPVVPLSTPGERVEERPARGGEAQEDSTWVTKMVGGQRYRIRRDDPLLTGQMIKVTSSNVHSIGFIWNDKDPAHGTLCVRFLHHEPGQRKTGRAGAGYQYFAVHPQLFVAFTKTASKGKFVWDELRIRGTVSGHQYRYSIATLASDGYVPRKARRIGDKEYFLRRTVKGPGGKVYSSALPEREVGPYRPNRGEPNRGRPNRGEPNRGR